MNDDRGATTDRLASRWARRFRQVPEIGADLIGRYGDSARVYHDVRHLDDVLSRLDELADGRSPEPVVELAAWFHDAVYDVRRTDNEVASAALARRMLSGRVPVGEVEEVARLVLITADHAVAANDVHAAALCDADLAILASDRPRYDDYAARIRREYAHVCDDDFTAGRAAVLRQLLALPGLFHTAHGSRHWESPARLNLTRELQVLTAAR